MLQSQAAAGEREKQAESNAYKIYKQMHEKQIDQGLGL